MFFYINAIKKLCEKYMLLKQHVFFTYQETHVNLIYGLQIISYKPVCKKFISMTYIDGNWDNGILTYVLEL
jgi:hypothetical protein